MDTCPICAAPPDRIWIESEHAVAFAATDPGHRSHMIVAPRNQIFTIYQLPLPEQKADWALDLAISAIAKKFGF